MSSPAHPLRHGNCDRCEAGQSEAAVFCSVCGLRLQAGTVGPDAAVLDRETAWIAENPQLASDWDRAQERLEAARARVARRNAARRAPRGDAPAEHTGSHRDTERQEALEQLAYWTARGMLFADLAYEAHDRAQQAHDACRAAGASSSDIEACMNAAAPPKRPGARPLSRLPSVGARDRATTAAGGGGFFLFYAESGPDMDGDGDVDGGLIDTVTGGEDGGSLLDGLGDLFG